MSFLDSPQIPPAVIRGFASAGSVMLRYLSDCSSQNITTGA
jgi:hypothetical protein